MQEKLGEIPRLTIESWTMKDWATFRGCFLISTPDTCHDAKDGLTYCWCSSSDLCNKVRSQIYNPSLVARGDLKVNVQIFSYSLAKPSKVIFFPKVAKSEAKLAFSGTKEKCLSSGLEGPNPKISKPIIKPLPLGQFDFSVGGKSRFREGNRKECKIWGKVPRNGTKTLRLHILG